jgi:CarboxypepD_reg-like domain
MKTTYRISTIFFCFSFLISSIVVSGQSAFTLKGQVIDSITRQPLISASVFCQNTTYGMVTNQEGNFQLSLSQGGYDLVVSYTGYETRSFRISSSDPAEMIVALMPVDKSMEAVSIQVTNEVKDGWTKYGDFFSDKFLGTTPNRENCLLENPEALQFFYSKKRDRLKVKSKEDILILNKSLGYRIRYQLDSFVHEYTGGNTIYTGYPFFEELDGTREEKAVWEKNRRKAYYGSVLHFMRAYYDHKLDNEGFRILKGVSEKEFKVIEDPYSYLVEDSTGKEIQLTGKVRVIFSAAPDSRYLKEFKLDTKTKYQISILDLKDVFVIEENGYFWEQSDFTFFGYWDWKKVSDLLPYNYVPME